MYYRYLVNSDYNDYIPWEKQEWWFLISTHTSKEEALAWHNQHKHSNSAYKLVHSPKNLSTCFYPRKEIKRRTQTAKTLKNIKYGETNDN